MGGNDDQTRRCVMNLNSAAVSDRKCKSRAYCCGPRLSTWTTSTYLPPLEISVSLPYYIYDKTEVLDRMAGNSPGAQFTQQIFPFCWVFTFRENRVGLGTTRTRTRTLLGTSLCGESALAKSAVVVVESASLE